MSGIYLNHNFKNCLDAFSSLRYIDVASYPAGRGSIVVYLNPDECCVTDDK